MTSRQPSASAAPAVGHCVGVASGQVELRRHRLALRPTAAGPCGCRRTSRPCPTAGPVGHRDLLGGRAPPRHRTARRLRVGRGLEVRARGHGHGRDSHQGQPAPDGHDDLLSPSRPLREAPFLPSWGILGRLNHRPTVKTLQPSLAGTTVWAPGRSVARTTSPRAKRVVCGVLAKDHRAARQLQRVGAGCAVELGGDHLRVAPAVDRDGDVVRSEHDEPIVGRLLERTELGRGRRRSAAARPDFHEAGHELVGRPVVDIFLRTTHSARGVRPRITAMRSPCDHRLVSGRGSRTASGVPVAAQQRRRSRGAGAIAEVGIQAGEGLVEQDEAGASRARRPGQGDVCRARRRRAHGGSGRRGPAYARSSRSQSSTRVAWSRAGR